jgi:hypothetical protein
MNRDELKQAIAVVGIVDAAIFSAIPMNMKRYIYKIRATNLFAGPNILTIAARENTAGVFITRIVDRIHFAMIDDQITDPDELHEDSAPLYTIDGPSTVGMTSGIRAACSAAGTVDLFIEYVDAPA